MADIVEAETGDIVALFGIDCASGDTFTSDKIRFAMTLDVRPAAGHPPDGQAEGQEGAGQHGQGPPALHQGRPDVPRARRRRVGRDGHLGDGRAAPRRLRRAHEARVQRRGARPGRPQVAYREAITRRAEFNYLHKKQTGGSGQYGKVGGYVEPYPEGEFEFVNDIFGGSIPSEFIPSVEKGFRSMLKKGRLIGFPLTNFRVVINDGAAHAVDSSDNAFQAAARGAFRDVYDRAKPAILEPIMKVAVEGRRSSRARSSVPSCSDAASSWVRPSSKGSCGSMPTCRWPRCSATPRISGRRRREGRVHHGVRAIRSGPRARSRRS